MTVKELISKLQEFDDYLEVRYKDTAELINSLNLETIHEDSCSIDYVTQEEDAVYGNYIMLV